MADENTLNWNGQDERRHCQSHESMFRANTESTVELEGLKEALNSRLSLVTWVVGIGMTLNLFIVGGASTYLVGMITSNSNTMSIVKDRQDRVVNDLNDLKLKMEDAKARVDALERERDMRNPRVDSK